MKQPSYLFNLSIIYFNILFVVVVNTTMDGNSVRPNESGSVVV